MVIAKLIFKALKVVVTGLIPWWLIGHRQWHVSACPDHMTLSGHQTSMDGVTFGTQVLVAVLTETLDLDIFPSGLVTRLTIGVVVLVTGSMSRDKAVGHSKNIIK